MDTDSHPLELNERLMNVNIPRKSLRIESGALIDAETMTLKDVTIGKNSVKTLRCRIA